MLIDLVLTVCMAANADNCRTEHVYYEHHGSLMQCMIRAPAYIARWSQEHPGHKVTRWKCMTDDGGRDI